MGLQMNSVVETQKEGLLTSFTPEYDKPEVDARPEIINLPDGEKFKDKFISEEQRELLLPQILVS